MNPIVSQIELKDQIIILIIHLLGLISRIVLCFCLDYSDWKTFTRGESAPWMVAERTFEKVEGGGRHDQAHGEV